jgi:hypothetical protein
VQQETPVYAELCVRGRREFDPPTLIPPSFFVFASTQSSTEVAEITSKISGMAGI